MLVMYDMNNNIIIHVMYKATNPLCIIECSRCRGEENILGKIERTNTG